MNKIEVQRKPDERKLSDLKVYSWPVWEKEASEFPWTYDERESCLILEGEVIVTPDGGEPVKIEKGDFVTFPRGMQCIWKITRDIRKHYNFG